MNPRSPSIASRALGSDQTATVQRHWTTNVDSPAKVMRLQTSINAPRGAQVDGFRDAPFIFAQLCVHLRVLAGDLVGLISEGCAEHQVCAHI